MALLVFAALIWLGIHIGIAGTRLREMLVARVREGPFRGAFSLLSILAIVLLGWAWSRAETTPLWPAPGWLRWALAAVVLAAFVLLVASVARRNPTMLAGEAAMAQAPQGIHRVTRHPMLWSFALWAATHVLGSEDSAAILLCGTLMVTSLAGMPSIDAKLARRDPATFQTLSATTSILPFAAIAQARNRFVPGEIGWSTLAIGIVAWAAALYVHPWLFGVAPVAL